MNEATGILTGVMLFIVVVFVAMLTVAGMCMFMLFMGALAR